MLRISPKANQFTLPSPQPLAMLLQGVGGNTTTSPKNGSGSEYDFKMNPGDKESFIRAKINLESEYQSRLNKVFHDGLNSNEGPYVYTRSDEAINELQGYIQDYENKKIALDSQQDYLEANVKRSETQEGYFASESLTDNDYVFGIDTDKDSPTYGQDKVGIDTEDGTIMSVGQLKEYNLNKQYNKPFVDYVAPAFTELDKVLTAKLNDAAKDDISYSETVTGYLAPGQMGRGKSLTAGQKEITYTTYSDGQAINENQLNAAFASFEEILKTDATLARAYNIRKLYYQNRVSQLPNEEKAKMPSFREWLMQSELDKERIFKEAIDVKDYVDPNAEELENEVEGVQSNYYGSVLFGADFTKVKETIMDDPKRIIIEQVPNFFKETKPGEDTDPNFARFQRYYNDYNNVIDKLIEGEDINNIQMDLVLRNVLSDERINSIYGKLQYDPNTDIGKDELRMYLGEGMNDYIAEVLNEEDFRKINKSLYNTKNPLILNRKESRDVANLAMKKANAEITRREGLGGEFTFWERNEERNKLVHEYEGELRSSFTSTALKPTINNYTTKQIIRYAGSMETHVYPKDAFRAGSQYYAQVTDDILFNGSFKGVEELTYTNKDGKVFSPVIVNSRAAYPSMHWKDDPVTGEVTKVLGSMVQIMIPYDEGFLETIEIELPDASGKIKKTNLKDIDESDYYARGIEKSTVSAAQASLLAGNNDYNEDSKVMLLWVNMPYPEMINDWWTHLSPSEQTTDAKKKIASYYKNEANNVVMFKGFDTTTELEQ